MDRATLLLALLGGCVPRAPVLHTHIDEIDPRRAPYLKAHLHDGSVVVLDEWRVGPGLVQGQGWALDPNREVVGTAQPLHALPPGELAVALDDVAVFETARRQADPSTYWMTSIGVLNGVLLGLLLAPAVVSLAASP